MKPYLILLAFLLVTVTALAQKNAPVAGQASVLIDLLKKDYSSIDPDLAGDQLVTDRAQVISIFKSFLINTSYAGYPSIAAYNSALLKAKNQTAYYLADKRAGNNSAITSVSTSDLKVYKAMDSVGNAKSHTLDTSRTKYYNAKFVADTEQLSFLYYEFGADKDPFVQSVVKAFIAKYKAINGAKNDEYATVNPNGLTNKALPVIGAFGNTTEVIDGISKFIAKRLKQELTTFAVQNIQSWLEAHSKTTPTEELLTLFPATAAYLMKFDADKVASFPAEIKQYIESDLNHLMDNGYQLKNTTLFRQLISQNPDMELAFEAFHLIPQLTRLKNPSDFITVLNSSDLMLRLKDNPDEKYVNLVSAFSFLEMMSNSLTITNNGEPQYSTVDFWGTYGREVPFMKLYLGFVYQQNAKYYKVQFSIKKTLYPVNDMLIKLMAPANDIDKTITALQPVLTDICKNAENIYNQAQTLRKINNAGQKLGADTIFSFNKSVIDFARDLGNDGDKLIKIFTPNGDPVPLLSDHIKKYVMVADTANDALKDIYDKKYASGIVELLEMAYLLVPNQQLQQTIDFLKFYSLSTITSASWADWNTFQTFLTVNGGTPTPGQVNAAIKLGTELTKISAFYANQPSPSKKTTNMLLKTATLLSHIRAGLAADTAAITSLKTYWSDQDYQTAVVSYYAHFIIDKQLDELIVKMTTPISDGKGNIAPPLNQQQINIFKTVMAQYISHVFTDMVVQQHADTTLVHSYENQAATIILTYLNNLPAVFGGRLDSRVVSLIHFINDMALAKNSDDVEQAIEALALPAGSYSIKQSSYYTVTVNTFPGIIGGWEFTSTHSTAGSIGFTAPVGLNMTWGHVYKNNTLGLFVPLIDIGAVTRLRLDGNNDTQTLPDLTWKNVFSPGLYLTIGLGKTPFSINLGAQYGPEVKDISSGMSNATWRLGGGITVDIPFFTIYNKPINK